MSKKYNKKNNMKHAMYEMFGVGEEQTEHAEQIDEPEEKMMENAAPEVEVNAESEAVFDKEMEEYEPKEEVKEEPKYRLSYLAPGTIFEGTLRSRGNVEVAGEFNGDVKAEGKVILSSVVRGNVMASDLDLNGCTLEGDVTVKGMVNVSEDSSVCGNIKANEVQCAGQITGDLNVAEDTALESTAVIHGVINTSTMSMKKGAMIKGGIEMNVKDRERANK